MDVINSPFTIQYNNMKKKIAVIGLGYVGLPLAVEFAKHRAVIGYEISKSRIKELNEGHDPTLEVVDEDLQAVLGKEDHNIDKGLYLTDSLSFIHDCEIYIIAVPTPTDKNNRPDLTPLIRASETVGNVISKGNIVIYESTVYPGATEEDCIPVVEQTSGLKFNTDFYAGYSPERINPGDKVHTLTTIMKVTSGSNPEIGNEVNDLYSEIITAGTHLASSIKVAEAAKVIENSQRDINIAFVNELSKIFNLMGIDTLEVLEAAGTKWNFLPFRPGLVGGHCIGIDPYYLAQKAQEVGYHPEIILAGRRLNDSMGAYVASEVVKLMLKSGKPVKDNKALMLGITFKENCPDIRNTRAIDIYNELKSYGMDVDVFDPWANPDEVKHEYGIDILTEYSEDNKQGVIILAVAHNEFQNIDLHTKKENGIIVFDVKGLLPKEDITARL
jgi:UDP-N-acetyl-D-glucosamine/UDP-N-acetyl-D-galactosamine dehydrogenase